MSLGPSRSRCRSLIGHILPCSRRVAVVGPGETRRIEVTFAPPRWKGPKQPPLRDQPVIEEPDWKKVLGLPDEPPPPPTEEEEPEDSGDDDDRTDEELREQADSGDATALELLEKREARAARKAQEEEARLAREREHPRNRGRAPLKRPSTASRARRATRPLMNDDDIEPWSEHGAWKLPCYVQDCGPPLMLEVHTTAVERIMVRLRTTRLRAVGRGTDEDFAAAIAELVRGRYDFIREECGRSQCRGALLRKERATTACLPSRLHMFV